jgi:hypothetical protein
VQVPPPRVHVSRDPHENAAFPALTFTPRDVPITTHAFDFEAWKSQCSHPVVLRGVLSEWPVLQRLAACADDDARAQYLGAAFGRNSVEYTRVPLRDPFMGYDEHGRQNFSYALAECSLSEFCEALRAARNDPCADVLYARGGANALRGWRDFSAAIRPLPMLKGMAAHGEGIWLGSGRHTTYLHQDAHFNFFAMLAGTKRVLLYPLEAIADLYPTPFFGGIAGTTSSFVRPVAPDYETFPRFRHAASQSWSAILGPGDLLCIPPCWWHHVEAAPGLNLMINAFVWALEPRTEYAFEVAVRNSSAIALRLAPDELRIVRQRLYESRDTAKDPNAGLSRQAHILRRTLARFLTPPIPPYWQKIARCYYDHYIFQVNGEPVPVHSEQHAKWLREEASLTQRLRQWLRFQRGLLRMRCHSLRARGLVP